MKTSSAVIVVLFINRFYLVYLLVFFSNLTLCLLHIIPLFFIFYYSYYWFYYFVRTQLAQNTLLLYCAFSAPRALVVNQCVSSFLVHQDFSWVAFSIQDVNVSPFFRRKVYPGEMDEGSALVSCAEEEEELVNHWQDSLSAWLAGGPCIIPSDH